MLLNAIIVLQISRQSIKACMNFKVLQKEEKYEENETNFEVAYLSNSLTDSTHIWNRKCHTPSKFTQKNFMCFCSGSAELQMHENIVLFTSVKYTLVCRVS